MNSVVSLSMALLLKQNGPAASTKRSVPAPKIVVRDREVHRSIWIGWGLTHARGCGGASCGSCRKGREQTARGETRQGGGGGGLGGGPAPGALARRRAGAPPKRSPRASGRRR